MVNQIEPVGEDHKTLSFQLKIGELIVINGARVRIERKGDNGCLKLVIVAANPRVLIGRQIIEPVQATSPFRRLYHDLQQVFVTNQCQEAETVNKILANVEDLINQATKQDIKMILAKISLHIQGHQFHYALKDIRILIENHDPGGPGDWPPPRIEPPAPRTFSSQDQLYRAITGHNRRR